MDRFKGIADDYDLWMIIDSDYEPLHRRVIELIRQGMGDIGEAPACVLEVGCGTGHTTEMLLGIDDRLSIWAIDASQDMVTKTRNRFCDLPKTRLRVLYADIVADNRFLERFRAVVSVFTMHNIQPCLRPTACRRIFDSLERGGFFITGDQLPPDETREGDWFYQKWVDALEKAKSDDLEHAGVFDFWLNHTIEDSERRLTEDAQAEMLEAAGFIEITLHERFGIYRIVTARKPK